MPVFVALLRAVNVGGVKLPMSELKHMCEALGYRHVRTYIASGNVIFDADGSERRVAKALEARLEAYAGRPVGVVVRSAAEMAQVLTDNPFKKAPPSRTVVVFLDSAPPKDTTDRITGQQSEEVRLGVREIYVHYPDGIGTSKLTIPAAKRGTARNMNTVARLAEMASALQAAGRD